MRQRENRFEEAGRDIGRTGISGQGHDDRSVGEEVRVGENIQERKNAERDDRKNGWESTMLQKK